MLTFETYTNFEILEQEGGGIDPKMVDMDDQGGDGTDADNSGEINEILANINNVGPRAVDLSGILSDYNRRDDSL